MCFSNKSASFLKDMMNVHSTTGVVNVHYLVKDLKRIGKGAIAENGPLALQF